MSKSSEKGYSGLFKDVVIYGASSIIGRFVNYLLVPLYLAVMPAASGSYGVVTNMYAIIALLLVVLTYGMETGFFYYANDKKENPESVFSTILIAVGFTSLLFVSLSLLNINYLAGWLGYAEHPEYLGMMLAVVGIDAFLSIPFAYLRFKGRPIKFAGIRLFFIGCNILLNIFFLICVPKLQPLAPSLFSWYDSTNLEGYIFLANLIAVLLQSLFFIPELRSAKFSFDYRLFKRIFSYSFPILILGVAGVLSQTFDKIAFLMVYPNEAQGRVELGIYGAATKIAMIMAMCTQAFRYAYEPFVFNRNKEGGGGKAVYAEVMKFFIIFTLLGFLAVVFYLDIIKLVIIKPDYWDGLKVVPIVMIAEIFMGVYFNLAYWYKLIEQTKWGAYFSIIGCVLVISINVLFIPVYGYMACAWAGVIAYGLITVLSYLVGQRVNPIKYDLKRISAYVLLTLILYFIGTTVTISNIYWRMLFRTVLLSFYVGFIIKKDLPLSKIPILNKLINKSNG